MRRCILCGESERETDLVACATCGVPLCYECAQWCCDEDDEDNGDWFCEECVRDWG